MLLAIAFTLVLTVPAGAAPVPAAAAAPPCQLFADVPFWDGGGNLVGVGGRIYCSSIRTVTVLLRQDRPWWPDRTLATSPSRTGTTVILEARRYCTGNSDMKVYTETRTNTGGKVQSGRLLTSC